MERFTALLILCLSAVAMATPAAGGYRLLQTIPVPDGEGWDHPTVDSDARRLYVTHGAHVAVIDVDLGNLVGKIDNTPGAHFTVIDPELDRGFISNGGAARLTIFTLLRRPHVGAPARSWNRWHAPRRLEARDSRTKTEFLLPYR